MNNQTESIKPKMLPAQDLFKKTFLFFKENIKEFLLITLFTLLPIIIFEIMMDKLIDFAQNESKNIWVFTLAFIILMALAVIAILSLLQQIILINFINKKQIGIKHKIKELFTINKSHILSYIWLNILMAAILMIGILAIILSMSFSNFFTMIFANKIARIIFLIALFIITVAIILYLIYLSVSFIFSYFILLCDDVKGLKSIMKSHTLSKNYWWPIVFRLILLNLAIIALTAAIIGLNTISNFIPVKEIFYALSTIYYLVFTCFAIPFTTLYLYYIYADLKNLKDASI